MISSWHSAVKDFLQSVCLEHDGTARSTPGGPVTLYGTCYAIFALRYLNIDHPISESVRQFVIHAQDAESGLLIGPELRGFQAGPGVLHDREHLLLHLTCAALPFCQEYSIVLPYPIRAAHRFCDLNYLKHWTASRNWKNAWFEGNNILFVGQLLVYLRDKEKYSGAAEALQFWFDWLDRSVDPKTGLWGTNGFCSPLDAVCGGYHQLLVYYHEDHPMANIRGLVDTVLSLQHADGGFNPSGNGGACEDVDSVDILVNCYKRLDYRRAEIRNALRRCLKHILLTQNSDGGFPYNRNCSQSHMGIPGTQAGANVSCTFPTWFRIHTLALIAEIIPDHPELEGNVFRFNSALSMGWHSRMLDWKLDLPTSQLVTERWLAVSSPFRESVGICVGLIPRIRRKAVRLATKLQW
jgi:hypothetical protein